MNNFSYIFLVITLFLTYCYIFCNGQVKKCSVTAVCEHQGKIQLYERSWKLMLEGEWLVAFCVPLIPNCHKFERIWTKFALDMRKEQDDNPLIGNLTVATMELEYSETIARRFSLTTLPIILHVKDGIFRRLPVAYNVAKLKDMILSGAMHKAADPLPFWMQPNGWVINLGILHLQAIDWVYKTAQFIEYDHAIWLVRIFLMILASMVVTLICGICLIIRNGILKWRSFCYPKMEQHQVRIRLNETDDEEKEAQC